MLLDVCKKYYDNLAWRFQAECPDGRGCFGVDLEKFNRHLLFEIPELLRDSTNRIRGPEKNWSGNIEDYNQYALLDLIEFIGLNCKDFKIGTYHSYFGHSHIDLLETSQVFMEFQKDINDMFNITGLLFILTDNKRIERVLENNVVLSEARGLIPSIKEQILKQLIEDAISLFLSPDPKEHKLAIDKIWDALERIKTYYSPDKKNSVDQLVKAMGAGQGDFEKLFDDEFDALTNFGNKHHIRHYETDSIEIVAEEHYEYLFNRCLTLIVTAVKSLK